MDFLDDYDLYDDDIEVIELVEVGIPRQILTRNDYYYTYDDLSFYKRFRIRKETAVELLRVIDHRLEFPYDTNNCVSPMNQLLLCLRYYATGLHLQCIGDFSGVHKSTACHIVKRVSEALAALSREYIKFPNTQEQLLHAQRDFFEIAAFPRVVAALDGTHCKIQSPGGHDSEVFRNRKQYFSINVQAASSASLKFLNIVARWPGSAHDATIFNNSMLKTEFENGMFPNSVMLGDSAYNAQSYLFTPLLNSQNPAEQLYNDAHIRTRNVVERLFGVWKRRFPVLSYGCRLKVDRFLTVIVATAVIHNIARDLGDLEAPLLDDEEQHILDQLIAEGDIPDIPFAGVAPEVNVRNNFIMNYFARLV